MPFLSLRVLPRSASWWTCGAPWQVQVPLWPRMPPTAPQPITDDVGDLPPGLALTIGTSGSTGRPKLAMLTGAALRASADATHQRLGGQGQWLLTMPAHHIAGIQVLVRSLVADTTPVCMDLAGGFTPAAFARATGEIASGARAYTALVPTQLVRLLASADGRQALTRYAAVLLGGGSTRQPARAGEGLRGPGGHHLRHERDRRRLRL